MRLLLSIVVAWVLVGLLAMGGCAVVERLTDDAAERAGKAIAEYCKLPAETREQFRGKVAEHAAPHSARIDCAAP
jgi:hypothetical protein